MKKNILIYEMVSKFLILLIVISTIAAGVSLYIVSTLAKRATNLPEFKNTPAPVNQNANSQNQTTQTPQDIPRLSTLAKNLEIPWSLVFLPSGEILFTERPGRVRQIDKDSNLKSALVAQINEVKHIGEGGLLGITIHPDFEDNKFVYIYYTYQENSGNTLNRVSRYVYNGDSLSGAKIILDKIPGASNHNGGRIKFGPDKFLYITTGDAQEPSRSQNTNSLAGKILRVTDEGQNVQNNPFNNAVYSLGHRNPQGITWDSTGRLWETEHGASATDELNQIGMGKNYGWPEIRGDEARDGMEKPVIHSGSNTWAPSAAAYFNGSIYFAGLRGSTLFEYEIPSGKLTSHLKGELGRIREVIVGPDHMLYITTNNRDGRGIPTAEDDRIIRVNPTKL